MRFSRRRNPDYCDAVRELPCCICRRGLGRQLDRTVVHHVVTRGAGGDDVGGVVPICVTHHDEVHRMGAKSFNKKYDVVLKNIATEYASEWI